MSLKSISPVNYFFHWDMEISLNLYSLWEFRLYFYFLACLLQKSYIDKLSFRIGFCYSKQWEEGEFSTNTSSLSLSSSLHSNCINIKRYFFKVGDANLNLGFRLSDWFSPFLLNLLNALLPIVFNLLDFFSHLHFPITSNLISFYCSFNC